MEQALTITKLEAARRQLEVAIELYFREADPVSQHTLVSAAYTVLKGLNAAAGGVPMIKDIPRLLNPEAGKRLAQKMNEAQNFLKHADADPAGVLTFKPLQTEIILFEACLKFQELDPKVVPLIRLYLAWFAMQNPELFKFPEHVWQSLSEQREAYQGYPRSRFFDEVRSVAQDL